MWIRRAALAAAALAGTIATTAAGGTGDGFTLRIASADDVDSLDPALATTHVSLPLVSATCSTLYRVSLDSPSDPVRLEAAAGLPRVSSDGVTYTIEVRRGLRFSDGAPVTAASYAAAIARVRSFSDRSPWSALTTDVARVAVRAGRLVVRLRRPAGDLVSRLAMPWACPVPPRLPADPGGLDLLPSSGPYVVASRTPGREVVLRRNARYQGTRPRRADTLVLTVGGTAESNASDVEEGRSDFVQYAWLLPPPSAELLRQLVDRHGVNEQSFFARPSLGTVYLALNTERPLFRDNARLRRAVNLALDRPEILRQGGFLRGRRTDQLLPPSVPGFAQRSVYPLGAPRLDEARRLAAGNLRGGQAILYTADDPPSLRRADVIRFNLGRIGLTVEIRAFPRPIMAARAARRGEPFDLVLTGWHAHYPDPAEFLVWLLDGELRPQDNVNLSYFQGASRAIRAAHRLEAPTRYEALGRLEAEIMREHAPVAALFHPYSYYLLSRRVGCLVLTAHGPEYGSLCLR
jgi:peptide/nickel transport system substrate-binding protein